MAERNLSVDHTTVWRWVHAYAPEIRKRLQGQPKYKPTTWFMDETYVRVGGRWMYLFRAVDNRGDTVDFYLSERVTVTRPSASCRPHSRIPITGRPGSFLSMETVAIEQRSAICAMMVSLSESADIDGPATEQPHQIRASARKASLVRHAGARTPATARVVIQRIEAAQMIRKGQVLGIPRDNRRGQAWVFGALLDLE